MKVVHVLASAATSWGGPTVVVRALTEALSARGVENVVVSLADPGFPSRSFSPRVKVRSCGDALIPRLGIPASPSMVGTLYREIATADLVHLHELWHLPQLAGGILAHGIGRPYVISPHGGLNPTSFAYHQRLKTVAWFVLQKRILDGAVYVHALTPNELADVQQRGVRAPVRVVPNGVDLGLIDSALEAAEDMSSRRNGPYILYMGRLDPRKGLALLLESFAELVVRHKGLRLVLAGTDSMGLWSQLRIKAQQLGVSDKVVYLGFVDGPSKFRLLREAEAFVLPSASEGMSVALLEGLACGVPAVVSTGCKFPNVEEAQAGRVVEPTAGAFAEAISGILTDAGLRRTLSRNAKTLVRECFSIQRMATEVLGLYEDALSGTGQTSGLGPRT